QGRYRRFKAILPIKRKILNVEKARFDKMLGSDEIKTMIAALGCGIGAEDFDLTKLRYHRIIIMTDADVDGSHIRTLLLTFFYRQLPKVIESGYIYIAQPPLFRVKRGKSETYIKDERDLESYLIRRAAEARIVKFPSSGTEVSGADLEKLLQRIIAHQKLLQLVERRGYRREMSQLTGEIVMCGAELPDETPSAECEQKPAAKAKILDVTLTSPDALVDYFIAAGKKGVAINRYKGLGEMNPEQLWETTMDPGVRTLLQVRAEDHTEADQMFTTLMGDQVEPRRKFIEDNALHVKNLDV